MLARLKSQGPYCQGHWLLRRLRHAAGNLADEAVCGNLAQSLTIILRKALLVDTSHEKADASHIRTMVTTAVAAMTSRADVMDAWHAFLWHLAAACGVGSELVVSVWTPASQDQLDIVLDELLETWGMITLGR